MRCGCSARQTHTNGLSCFKNIPHCRTIQFLGKKIGRAASESCIRQAGSLPYAQRNVHGRRAGILPAGWRGFQPRGASFAPRLD